MNGTLLAQAIVVDTSAAIALKDDRDDHHRVAKAFFDTTTDFVWALLNVTSHEAYTRARYDHGFHKALSLYDFLRGVDFLLLPFTPEDEVAARDILLRFRDQKMSFHDALCATIMKRVGAYRIFTFDFHFRLFGFEVLPGPTKRSAL